MNAFVRQKLPSVDSLMFTSCNNSDCASSGCRMMIAGCRTLIEIVSEFLSIVYNKDKPNK